MTRIAVDAMGGDHAPYEIVAGAVWAAEEYGVALELVGKPDAIQEVLDDVKLNKKLPDEERRIPYQNMIYFGDGLTDVPCMKLVKQYGGHSIAIYNKKEKHKVEQLLRDERVNFIAESNYSENSPLEVIVKQIIKKVVADNELLFISKEHTKLEEF